MNDDEGIPAPEEPRSLGGLLKESREALGLSREQLATELKLPVRLLAAIESDDWDAVPPGRERPLARQLAARLRMDLDHHPDALGLVPGGGQEAADDPRLERLERGAMVAVGLGSLALLAWLVIPGPSLRGHSGAAWLDITPQRMVPPPPPKADGPNPVLGELLPEAPITTEGILVSLRAQDACEAEVVGADGAKLARSLQVSDPWKLRVKAPFQLSLSNAGVVQVEVAGKPVATGASVGQPWSGRFDENGVWRRPRPQPVPAEPLTQEPAPEQPPAPPDGTEPEPAPEPGGARPDANP
ncbi:MAG TPA: helix-turn-helix domain-containing protein [Holophagaceae bacterium]|jgi:cytoskeleton protein RodZ|nr:helix-turn-helix domain-containing protein [Holophagaceae bacterium]